jgi:hypothetical protein
MLELSSIAEFSRFHCISICTILVPINLCLAGTTTILVASNRSTQLIYPTVCVSVLPAVILLLHVATWWSIGIVMLPTFILPMLAIICLANNAYAIIAPEHMRNLVITILEFSIAKYRSAISN